MLSGPQDPFNFCSPVLSMQALHPHGHEIAALPAGITFLFKAGKRQVKGKIPMQAESVLT